MLRWDFLPTILVRLFYSRGWPLPQTLRGFMLLAAVLLHVVVAGALLPQLLAGRPVRLCNDLITVRIADSPIKYPLF